MQRALALIEQRRAAPGTEARVDPVLASSKRAMFFGLLHAGGSAEVFAGLFLDRQLCFQNGSSTRRPSGRVDN
jgi:hypothetical protein